MMISQAQLWRAAETLSSIVALWDGQGPHSRLHFSVGNELGEVA